MPAQRRARTRRAEAASAGLRLQRRSPHAPASSTRPATRCSRAAVPAVRLVGAPSRDVEEHLLHVLAAVALDQRPRRALVDDHAGAQHDHVVAHPLDLAHVMRREQHRAAGAALVVARDRCASGRRCPGRARRSARRAAAPRARSAPPSRAIRACAVRPKDCRRAAAAGRRDRNPRRPQRCARAGGARRRDRRTRQVLADGQPLGQVDVRRREVHPRQHAVALRRHVGAEHGGAARAGRRARRAASTASSSCRRRCRRAARSSCRAARRTRFRSTASTRRTISTRSVTTIAESARRVSLLALDRLLAVLRELAHDGRARRPAAAPSPGRTRARA